MYYRITARQFEYQDKVQTFHNMPLSSDKLLALGIYRVKMNGKHNCGFTNIIVIAQYNRDSKYNRDSTIAASRTSSITTEIVTASESLTVK